MITPSTVYWISQLDTIKDILSLAAVLGLLISLLGGFSCLVGSSCASDSAKARDTSKLTRFCLTMACVAVLSAAGYAFVPSTNTAAAMVVIPKIANSERIQDIGDGIVSLAEDWLKELAPKKEGGVE